MQSGGTIPFSSRNFSLFSSGIQPTAWGPPCYWAICFARSLLIWMLITSKKIASQHHQDWCLNEQLPHSLFSSSQSLSHVWLFVTPWTAACQDSPSITNSWSLLNSCPASQWYHPTISSSVILLLPSIFPSIRVLSNESVLPIRWPKYWSITFSISPSNDYSGLISFRMNWLDLLAVQGTLKSLLQYHSSEASILQCSAFFMSKSPIHTWLLEKP